MSGSKLDKALRIFTDDYSADLTVTEDSKFKIGPAAQSATAEPCLRLNEEERKAYIDGIISQIIFAIFNFTDSQ